MQRALGIAAALLVGGSAFTASAQTVNWNAQGAQTDYGSKPSMAVGYSVGFSQNWQVQVHQGNPGTLWYRSGIGGDIGNATFYQNGYRPSVARYEFDDNTNLFEVHQAQDGVGPLWYLWGTLSGVDGREVTWTAAQQYDVGLHPAVATIGGNIVEVHQAGAGVGPLWYRTAVKPAWTGAPGQVFHWFDSHAYDTGVNPSVAITTSNNGDVIVEVHQAQDGVGPLWYRTGILSPNGDYIAWNDSHQYDYGINPSVTVSGSSVVEVHQANATAGPLWYRTGRIQGSGIAWNDSHQYDNGAAPSVATDGSFGYEIHQASESGPTALWWKGFTLFQ
jgi:hypothetical protein